MNGVVIVDKPSQWTSFDVVRDIRRTLSARKAGHAGTLDPLATGVLPVCVNEATKLAAFFATGDKEYRAVLKLGVETDTLDAEGAVIARRNPAEIDEAHVRDVVHRFTGAMNQAVPRFSAVKYQGKPLYWWARNGFDVSVPPREVTIHGIDCEEIALPFVTVNVHCSKGTYIRQLCADIGARLGCGAHLVSLRRLRCGHFSVSDAVTIDGVGDEDKRRLVERRFLTMSEAASMVSSIVVDDDAAMRIRRGVQPTSSMIGDGTSASLGEGDMVKFITFTDDIVAFATMTVSSDAITSLADGVQIAKIARVFHEKGNEKVSR